MNKYTIFKVFEKHLPAPIWKIEVDCAHHCIAIEYRNTETTLPSFSILGFDGSLKCTDLKVDEKEWTLEALQGNFLILKRFGTHSPIESGIRIIHFPSGEVVTTLMEYVLQEVYQDTILARHRSIPSGLKFSVDIATGMVQQDKSGAYQYPAIDIRYPLAYTGHLPRFIQDIPYQDTIWLLAHQQSFIWAYHLQNKDKYDLFLSISSKDEIFDTKIIFRDFARLIPQPFFIVERYIFFLSNTKQEIVAYLV